MIKRLVTAFLGSYAFFFTLNPLVINKDFSHWENVKYAVFLSGGVTLGILLEFIVRRKIRKSHEHQDRTGI